MRAFLVLICSVICCAGQWLTMGDPVFMGSGAVAESSTIYPNFILFEGFEGTGYEGAWSPSGSAGGPEPDFTGVVLSGNQSFHLNPTNATMSALSATFSARDVLYGYFQFQHNGLVTSSRIVESFGGSVIRTASGQQLEFRAGSSGNGPSSGVLASNTLYHVWWEWHKGAGADAVLKGWISTTGSKPASPTLEHTNGTSTTQAAVLRLGDSSNNGTQDIVLDNVILSDTPIGSNPQRPTRNLSEGFEFAAGFDSIGWSTNGSPNPDADISGLSGNPAGAGNQALYCSVDGSVGLYAKYDLGYTNFSATTPLTVSFYLYVVDGPDTSPERFAILMANCYTSPGSLRTAWVSIGNNSGNIQLYAAGATASSWQTITTGAWHKVVLYIATAASGSASWLKIDDGTALTFDRAVNDVRYLNFGAPYLLDAGENANFYVDLISVQ